MQIWVRDYMVKKLGHGDSEENIREAKEMTVWKENYRDVWNHKHATEQTIQCLFLKGALVVFYVANYLVALVQHIFITSQFLWIGKPGTVELSASGLGFSWWGDSQAVSRVYNHLKAWLCVSELFDTKLTLMSLSLGLPHVIRVGSQ